MIKMNKVEEGNANAMVGAGDKRRRRGNKRPITKTKKPKLSQHINLSAKC